MVGSFARSCQHPTVITAAEKRANCGMYSAPLVYFGRTVIYRFARPSLASNNFEGGERILQSKTLRE